MAQDANARPDKCTRTGKPRYFPAESDLYAKNGAPPVKFLGKLAYTYVDDEGNMYWDALKDAHLSGWIDASIIKYQMAENFEASTDDVFFVRQSAEQKANCAVFTLPDAGEGITLYTKKEQTPFTGVIVDVGQRASTSYTSRSVRWMMVRGLTNALS